MIVKNGEIIAIGKVKHDNTLSGTGQPESPLGISETVKQVIENKQNKLTPADNTIAISNDQIKVNTSGISAQQIHPSVFEPYALSADVRSEFDASAAWVNERFDNIPGAEAYYGGNGIKVIGHEINLTADVVSHNELTDTLNSYATKEWVEGKDYLTDADLSNYATKEYARQASAAAVTSAKSWVESQNYLKANALDTYAKTSDVNAQFNATSAWATETFQPIGNYVSATTLDNYYTKSEVNAEFRETSSWANETFQPVGDYVSASKLTEYYTKTEVDTLVDNSIADISATVSTDYLKKADVKEYSAGNNIDITNYVISGRDWSPELNTKVNNSDFTIYSADIDSQLVTLSANKLDKSYSATVNSLLDDKLDKTDFDTYSATVDNQISAKLNTSDFEKYKTDVSAEFSATSAWALDTFYKTSEYFYAVSGTNSSSEYFKWTGDTLSASWMVKHFNLSFNYAVKPVSASPDFIYSSHMLVGNTPIDDKHYVDGYSDTVNFNVSYNIYNADNKTYKFTFSADDKLSIENLYISCIGFINPRSLSGYFSYVENGTTGNFVDSDGNKFIFVEKLPVG